MTEPFREKARGAAANTGMDAARAHARAAFECIAQRRYPQAIEALSRALNLDPPGATPVAVHAGYQLLQVGEVGAAHELFARAREACPGDLPAQQGHVIALITLQRYEEALKGLEALQAVGMAMDYLAGITLHARLQCCDWTQFEVERAALAAAVRRGERADAPLSFIVHSDSPADQRSCAQIYVADKYAAGAPRTSPALEAAPRAARAPGDRLRIAYLSSDLRNHAIGQLMAGVFESHDRSRFETHAFCTGRDDGSVLRQRITRSFEHFLSVADWSDARIATRMAESSIDIVIDLGGHSMGGRAGVLAYRPAPLQVGFLGFPGTSGAHFVDYIIADRHVIPAEERPHYTEQVIYMPDACLPTDGPPQSGPLPTRAQAGLPEQGLVFCCFNASYKISPTAFEVWMRLLEAVPASVLWLRASSPAVRRNLSRAAASHGVDASRLIFAPRTATRAEHHARFSLADLFLDTSPYNGHTTASEALGLAVPVISLRGRSFASRVAASLLETCGLGALAVDSWDDYHDRALELAHAPEDLANLRQHLRRCRASSPLFDASRFCRHLEAAYAAIWDRHAGGATPATIWVPPLAS